MWRLFIGPGVLLLLVVEASAQTTADGTIRGRRPHRIDRAAMWTCRYQQADRQRARQEVSGSAEPAPDKGVLL